MKSNRSLRLSSFILTLGIALSSVSATALNVDFSEPIYELPGLRPVHDKFCKVVGIEDVSGLLASLPEKAKSKFGDVGKFIVEPWTKLACSRMTQGFWVGAAANKFLIDRYCPDKKFDWAPEWWPLSLKGLVKKCLTHVIAGSFLKDSLVREVLNTLYKLLISESIRNNYVANVYGKYAFNKFGKYAFNQILPQTHKA